ncbi:snRNA-activating protein complex subunit 3 [Musca vetustissima]|uniref:snRNA-activating protein complex subunit 3 n=1 Tax=Musca vetustissima TaxID=27455 RepID=UPI002AB7AB94|nr:snRNA-activating protein complex subunit 3 [Musca vetustissima]
MEEILGQAMLPPLYFKKFLSDYKKMFQGSYTLPPEDVDLQKILNLNDERFKTIEEECSLENLEHEDDARIAEFIPGFSEIKRVLNLNAVIKEITLKSYTTAMKCKQPRKYTNPFKRCPELYYNFWVPLKDNVSNSIDLQPDQELKITIRLYRPARVTHAGRTIERPVFSQEVECLGSNLLSELRDKISCTCNNKRFFDISENPEAPLPTKETDPGYFFITDTFYNDKRNPLNADYSENVRNWAKKAKGLSSLDFKVARMEDTRMIDLTASMGFPQLYQHHGNCEHVFVFSQLEVITNPAKQLLELHNYPHMKSVNRFTARACQICSKVNYVFVVEGSNRLLNDPAYLCRKCFMSYYYIDGKKVGEFRAYRLNDDETLNAADRTEESYVSETNTDDDNEDEVEANAMDSILNDSDEAGDMENDVIVKEEVVKLKEEK